MSSFLKVIWDLCYQLGLWESEYAEVKFIALGCTWGMESDTSLLMTNSGMIKWYQGAQSEEWYPQTSHFVHLHSSHSGSKIRYNSPTI